jgi:hypothetical protein
MLERVDDVVPLTGSTMISAAKELERLTGAGQGVNHSEGTALKKLFEGMIMEERDAFAQYGELPDWFLSEINATSDGGDQEGDK